MKVIAIRVNDEEEVNIEHLLHIRFIGEDGNHIDVDFSNDGKGIVIMSQHRIAILPRAANSIKIYDTLERE